jgi:predicted GIY-YIG superfamily endonuclease
MSRDWHTYVLENPAGKRYVGSIGREPQVRLAEHNAGLNRWTRANGPWVLIYNEAYATKSEAQARERYFKTGAGRRLRDELIRRDRS